MPLAEAIDAATPDVDVVGVDLDWLEGLGAVGERCLLVALPAPGRTAGLPGCAAEVRAAVLEVGECAYAPTLGGLLVPEVTTFGPDQDQGTRVDLAVAASDPVPAHVVDALDARAAERRLTQAMSEVTAALDEVGGRPFDSTLRADAEAGGRAWAVPPSVPPRLSESLARAATIERIARIGAAHGSSALSSAAADARTTSLARLRANAEEALAEIASCAALAVAAR